MILIGRATRDAEIRYSQAGEIMARFTLAVDRRFSKDGQRETDFINCVAFKKTGEFCEKYLRKGTKYGVVGRIQTGSYEKEGRKIYTTDVIAEDIEFVESKKAEQEANSTGQQPSTNLPANNGMDGFVNVAEGIDDELPFN